jgi:hypothetical protein
MPGIVDRLATAETARVLADERAVLADHHALGISLDLDRRPTAREATEYLLLSNRTRQVFETDAWTAWKPSNGPLIGTS